MAVEFAVFLPPSYEERYWLYNVPKLMVSAIDNCKTVAGRHTVHKQQAVIYGQRGADPQRGVAVVMRSYNVCVQMLLLG